MYDRDDDEVPVITLHCDGCGWEGAVTIRLYSRIPVTRESPAEQAWWDVRCRCGETWSEYDLDKCDDCGVYGRKVYHAPTVGERICKECMAEAIEEATA